MLAALRRRCRNPSGIGPAVELAAEQLAHNAAVDVTTAFVDCAEVGGRAPDHPGTILNEGSQRVGEQIDQGWTEDSAPPGLPLAIRVLTASTMTAARMVLLLASRTLGLSARSFCCGTHSGR